VSELYDGELKKCSGGCVGECNGGVMSEEGRAEGNGRGGRGKQTYIL